MKFKTLRLQVDTLWSILVEFDSDWSMLSRISYLLFREVQHASMYDIHASTSRKIQGPELIAGGGALIQGAVPVYGHKTLVLRHLHLKQQRPLRESTQGPRRVQTLSAAR